MNNIPVRGTPRLSIVVQTLNEAHNIADCIQSCCAIADEIIVLDMGSTDTTASIAEQLGVKVVQAKKLGFVEASRQVAIELAKNDWVFLLDADELSTPSLNRAILQLIRKPVAAYRLPRKNIFLGRWMKYGVQWPDYQVRLFKKQNIYWPQKIHTQPIVDGVIINLPQKTNFAITHHYRSSIAQAAAKILTQSSYEEYYSSVRKLTEKQVIARIENEFSWRYFDNDGYKDGVRGFLLAKLWEYYRFLEFAHFSEQNGFPEIIYEARNFENKLFVMKLHELEEQELSQIKNSKLFILYGLYQRMKLLLSMKSTS